MSVVILKRKGRAGLSIGTADLHGVCMGFSSPFEAGGISIAQLHDDTFHPPYNMKHFFSPQDHHDIELDAPRHYILLRHTTRLTHPIPHQSD